MAKNTALPLARFNVLDLTRARAGPTCVRQLVDWGAHAIKIEMPGGRTGDGMGGNRHGFDFQNLHRNKRGMTLNLREPEGVAIFKKLARETDIVVENYRPDVDRKSTRLNSSHGYISYAVFCLKKKKIITIPLSGPLQHIRVSIRLGLNSHGKTRRPSVFLELPFSIQAVCQWHDLQMNRGLHSHTLVNRALARLHTIKYTYVSKNTPTNLVTHLHTT